MAEFRKTHQHYTQRLMAISEISQLDAEETLARQYYHFYVSM